MTRASLLSLEPHFPIYTWDPQTGLCPVALMRVVQSYWKVCGVLIRRGSWLRSARSRF